MCDCDSVWCEFSDQKRVKARREHKCVDCEEAIKVGETYWYFSGKFDGEFHAWHLCLKCHELWDKIEAVFDENRAEFCVVYSCLGERFDEAWASGYLDDHKGLAVEWYGREEAEKMFADDGGLASIAVEDPRQQKLPFLDGENLEV